MNDTHDSQGPAVATPPPPPPGQGGSPPGAPPPPPPGHGEWRPPKRSGTTFGIVLVVLGIVIIADRVLPGVNIWEMWPLIVVAVGVVQLFSPKRDESFGPNRVVEGLTTIAVGLIFLGNTVGELPWSLWLSVLSLWPLLLIAAGLDIIGKSLSNVWLRLLSSLLILGGLLYGALVLPAGTFNLGFGIAGPASETFEFSERADPDIESGDAVISGGVGELTVVAGDDLAAVSGSTPFGEPVFSAETRGSKADVEVSLGSRGYWTGYRGRPHLDVELSEDVAWRIEIDSGVSGVDADLADLVLRELVVESGVSEVSITLGEVARGADAVPIKVSSGVSSIRIRIPQDEEFRISSAAGISIVNVDGSGGPAIGERNYESDGWDPARAGYDIDLSSGISSVQIDLY